MRQTDVEPLSPEVENLLAKERWIEPQPAERRARAMARARAAFRETPAPIGFSPWWRRATLLAAAALLTAVAAVAITTLRKPPVVDEAARAAPPARKVNDSPAPPAAVTAEPSSDAPKSELKPAPAEKVIVPSASRYTPSNADALELGLLQRARAGVARGDFAGALGVIAEHERRFPAGRLREEREALRVKALSGLGKKDEARAAAERFQSHYPRSVLSASIEEATRPRP
ncbi:MAG TPA: hypothetical protein VF103_04795 [Polyangiaceae bacterium]